uniref:Uncharacterized protein n=1 Tax=Arundo donax TaxID=35708 RepID=A0A0A9FHL5_ARUDO
MQVIQLPALPCTYCSKSDGSIPCRWHCLFFQGSLIDYSDDKQCCQQV